MKKTHFREVKIAMSNRSYNKQLTTISNDALGRFEGYIDTITNRYKVNFNYHDLAGLTKMNPALEQVLTPYLYHNNNFCSFIKKHYPTFTRCTQNKSKICNYCMDMKAPFYGTCYMGVKEFVFPVKIEGKLIGVLCAGQFYDDVAQSLRRIKKLSKKYGIDGDVCQKMFLDTARQVDFSITEFGHDVGILIESLALYYKSQLSVKLNMNDVDQYKNNFIVDNTIRFIKENYDKELSLQILASNSYCNASYLSSVFKTKTGASVTEYINQIRIEASKTLLSMTTLTITQVAGIVGYTDSNYFSRVFRQQTGMSPSEYRD